MEGNEANNVNPNPNAQGTTGQNNNANQPTNATNNNIDYNKIQEMIEGRNAKTEDSILKSYFQKQGLSQEEMESAINTFKAQRENQSNAQNQQLSTIQESLQKTQLENQRLKIEKKAYDFVDDLNVENKTMDYILKMADLNNCTDKDGNVLEDALKTALEKVVTDVPGLKKQVQGTVGITVGANTNNGTNSSGSTFDFGFTGVRARKQN